MNTVRNIHDPPPARTPPDGSARRSALGAALARIRRQIVAGLLLVLPIVVTFWIVYWLYTTLELYVISPAARLLVYLIEGRRPGMELPAWFAGFVAPLIGIIGVALLLYFFGAVARSRLAGLIDSLLLQVPVVKVIYNAVSRVFQSIKGQGELTRFKRVVLVSFPHPGMRVPGFVTSSCRDVDTQRTILCVYVPTTPVPTSGYMLLVPEDEVSELDWNLEETVQAVVSFGLTAPDHVRFFESSHAPGGGGSVAPPRRNPAQETGPSSL